MEKTSNKLVDLSVAFAVEILNLVKFLKSQHETIICNQIGRAGTSIGANNAEATNAISKADFKSKSFIALKEARESLYWIDLLHRNYYLDEVQYTSIHQDCEELVKLLMHRCKKMNEG